MLFALVVASPMAAEVKASHPESSPQEKTRLASPMVLELPLPTAEPARRDRGEQRPPDLQALKNFVCDGVGIFDASIAAQTLRTGEIRSVLKITFLTEPGVDKLVDVRTEVVSDGAMVALGIVKGIDAEEGKLARASLQMTVPVKYLATEKNPTLKIVLTVVANP